MGWLCRRAKAAGGVGRLGWPLMSWDEKESHDVLVLVSASSFSSSR
jgi:hypothetical protein